MNCTRNILWWILFLSFFGTFFALVWFSIELVLKKPETVASSDKKDFFLDDILAFVCLPFVLTLVLVRGMFFDKSSGSSAFRASDKDGKTFDSDRTGGYDLGEKHLGADDEYYIYNEYINK